MNSSEDSRTIFKKCPLCGYLWENRSGFLADCGLQLIGYQVSFSELTAGYFLFNHSCEGTLAVLVEQFEDLHHGPIYQTRKTGTEECPEYCLHQEELARCPAECECAFVREIIQLVRNWPKDASDHLRPVGV
jgi:hypothetical protein